MAKLYHFCADRHLLSIRLEGITLGRITTGSLEKPKFIEGYQWLTVNPEFNQCWNNQVTIPYDRTEWRLTINIPDEHIDKLFKWTDIGKNNPLYDTLNFEADFENWYLYHGRIFPKWIKATKRKNLIIV